MRDKTRNKVFLVLSVYPIFILSLILISILPDKYFYDNNRILSMVTGSGVMQSWEGSYKFAADLFVKIDVFNLTTVNQWHLLIGVTFNVIIVYLLLSGRDTNTIETIYLLAGIVLANIYTFTIGKDVIQFCLFFAIYIIIASNRLTVNIKTFLVTAILLSEGFYFKAYYFLIGLFFIGCFFLLKRTRYNLKKTFLIILVSIFLIMTILFICSKSFYMQIASIRYSINLGRESSMDARTAINDLILPQIANNNPILLIVNYCINALRLMIPLELLTKGVYYIPFFLFQVLTACFVYRYAKKCICQREITDILFFSVYIGFFLCSVFFEPDFGSWVRHEISIFPILIQAVYYSLLPDVAAGSVKGTK